MVAFWRIIIGLCCAAFWVGLLIVVCRCTPGELLPVKAAADDVVANCPLDITVRECLRNLIDESAKAYREKPKDGGISE